MLKQATFNDNPWCIVDDFNVINFLKENHRRFPHNMRKKIDFIAVIDAYVLLKIGFSGHKFTWSNKRGINHRIRKSFDRAMVNNTWLEKMPQTTITHLSSTSSDNCPLFMETFSTTTDHIKYFRFLNCSVDNTHFMETVKTCLEKELEGIGM